MPHGHQDEESAGNLNALADAITTHCHLDPGEPYVFTFNARAVAAIVKALREAALLRTPH